MISILDYLDRMFYLHHRLGIQSNVILSARYGPALPHDQSVKLSTEAVFAAVRAVVTEYPELGIVGVVEPPDRKGKHILSLASLHAIDLNSCIEFIDDGPLLETCPELLEKLHNEWLWSDGEIKHGEPWWKVIVLGRRDVVFAFHHVVCDGSFAMIFHQKFLAALNQFNSSSNTHSPASHIIRLDPERVKVNHEVEGFIMAKAAILPLIFNALVFVLIRLFFGNKLFFSDFPKPRPYGKDAMAVVEPSQRTISRVTTLRVSSERMGAILKACRAHGTTFTPFLIVLTKGTLAANFYPQAKLGFSRYATDMRIHDHFASLSTSKGRVISLAGGLDEIHWLGKYRSAFASRSPHNEKDHSEAQFDVDAIWSLVKNYGQNMKEKRAGGEKSTLVQTWRAGNAVPPSIEDMVSQCYPSLGLHMQNGFSVSNVGALKPLPSSSGIADNESPQWKIEDVQFSVGAVNGAVGCHGIIFNVAGLAGGDTVINAVTENGMAPEKLPAELWDGVYKRIDAILAQDSKA